MNEITKKRIGYCREMARKILREFNEISLPIPINDIAKFHGFTVLEIDFNNKISGKFIKEKKAIGINKNHHINRRRFSLAHELGHYFLGHPSESSYYVVDEEKELRKIYDQEADEFASELLIPLKILKTEIRKNNDIEYLSILFQVSRDAMTIKISNSGLLSKL